MKGTLIRDITYLVKHAITGPQIIAFNIQSTNAPIDHISQITDLEWGNNIHLNLFTGSFRGS